MSATVTSARDDLQRKEISDSPTVDQQRFRDAMASFPSGVTVVTTVDRRGAWRGFTASSFCSVSVDPPLVIVCLATSAECHPAFVGADHWAIHVVGNTNADIAMRFATRGADKFGAGDFRPGEHGLPLLDDVSVRLSCSAHGSYPAGDHTVLVGRVEDVHLGEELPAVYFRRRFHDLGASESSSGA